MSPGLSSGAVEPVAHPGLSSQAAEQDQHFQCVNPLICFRHWFGEKMNNVVKCLFLLGTMKVFRAEIQSLTLFYFVWGALQYLPGLPAAPVQASQRSYGHSLHVPEESKMTQRPLFRWLNPCQMPAWVQMLPPGWNLCSGPMNKWEKMEKRSIGSAWRFRSNETWEHVPQEKDSEKTMAAALIF